MKYAVSLSYFVLSLLLIPSALFASEEKVVRLATEADYPPFIYTTKGDGFVVDEIIPPGSDSSHAKGYSWDIVRTVFHRMDYTISLTIAPWKRAVRSLEHGRADLIFPITKNPERQRKYQYSLRPLHHSDAVIYVHKDRYNKSQNLSSFFGKQVAMIRGYNYGEYFNSLEPIKKYPIDNMEQGFKMLQHNNIDGMVGYDTSNDYFLKQNGLLKEFKKLTPFFYAYDFMAGMKYNDQADILLEVFDQGYDLVSDSGDFDQLKLTWDIK